MSADKSHFQWLESLLSAEKMCEAGDITELDKLTVTSGI
jgi:hypothetical protein